MHTLIYPKLFIFVRLNHSNLMNGLNDYGLIQSSVFQLIQSDYQSKQAINGTWNNQPLIMNQNW